MGGSLREINNPEETQVAPVHNQPNRTGDNPDRADRQMGHWKLWMRRTVRAFDAVSLASKVWHYLFNDDDGPLAPLRELVMTLIDML